MPSEQTTVKWL